jgi:segregation and condensation protein A
MEFTLKLDRFEGPYTKLLELIESRKLSITEISLVDVSDEYIAYIKTFDQKNITDISQFIVVASTLMLMKAKSLLPGVVYTEEEEKQVHDLEFKLELYALLSKGGEKIKSIYGKHVLYSRPHFKPKNLNVFVPDIRVTPEFLQSVMSLTLMSFISPKALVKVAVEQAMRIENVIESLLERVKNAQTVTLQNLAGVAESKEDQKKLLIVNFLALLELLKVGSLQATQSPEGGEIVIAAPDVTPSTTVV